MRNELLSSACRRMGFLRVNIQGDRCNVVAKCQTERTRPCMQLVRTNHKSQLMRACICMHAWLKTCMHVRLALRKPWPHGAY
jgi:hypothetical protein